MSQYVALDLDTGSDDYRQWTREFPPSGRGIPQIFIVSARGEEYVNRTGAPGGDELAQMLRDCLQRAGQEYRLAQAERQEREEPEPDPETPPSRPAVESPPEYESIVDKLRRADSYLNMAETFAESRPAKAREYAQRIIDLVPDSDQARAARRIIEDLE